MSTTHYETTETLKLKKKDLTSTQAKRHNHLQVSDMKRQEFWGFGQTFNELGTVALQNTTERNRDAILNDLFQPGVGMNYSICRIPVGASDYALSWYSADETPEDYDLANFSIERDKKYLLPYIKEALKRNPDIKFSASPWSPPTWMKTIPVYNYGVLKHDAKTQQAYADYFAKFIRAYDAEGVHIGQLYVQNEPQRDQKFPSCYWTGEELRDFIKIYLGPTFGKLGLDTEIWLGTINSPLEDTEMVKDETTDYPLITGTVLSDPETYQYVKGVTYQWAGKSVLQRTVQSFPELGYLQSESECGNGRNTWVYAEYVFNLYRHYISNGVNGYLYWNSVLNDGGESTWGWHQNSMISINPDNGEVTYNPEYYVMKHFAHFVKPGAHVLDYSGHLYGESVAFENPDAEIVVVMSNSMNSARDITISVKGQTYEAVVQAHSFNTFVID
ncbi:glycosyl hydrolase [Sporolactobacillus shoreicorticis]|uniref:Glycoside hydrolase family 30 beta sandwich domain-containing protein n=1 Tax=Sporolactobacillus shoreicorticis TaxID=1923877 RepID=A0ABW5RZF4_9BACL|nr:glycoside hydrolase family 30 protein [Sporolactobacillus shoreicorticis]MCO7125162.1 glycosyl hydrolase [Sporolactobacillus shoreicorticis]